MGCQRGSAGDTREHGLAYRPLTTDDDLKVQRFLFLMNAFVQLLKNASERSMVQSHCFPSSE